jgi:hypothetical protein
MVTDRALDLTIAGKPAQFMVADSIAKAEARYRAHTDEPAGSPAHGRFNRSPKGQLRLSDLQCRHQLGRVESS